MTIIHPYAGLYGSIESPSKTGARESVRSTDIVDATTVHLSRDSSANSHSTYTKPVQPASATTASDFNSPIRELTPVSNHPKAFMASKTFLDIAHFDPGMHIVDVYA